MKNIIKKTIKNENGSITVFVVATMLFILVLVMIFYFSKNNKATTQNKDIIQHFCNHCLSFVSLDDKHANIESKSRIRLICGI